MKFSIITPSYNQASFLEQTIRSVVRQKGSFSLEYLLIDGGSTDGSVGIIKKYAKKYPQIIKWQSKKDKGQVDALNQGIKKSTGDIIAYLNSDDYYLPETLQKVTNFFIQNPKKLWLVGNCSVTKPDLKWTFFLKHLWPIHYSKNAIKALNTINQPAVFLQAKLVKEIGLFNPQYHYAFDYDYWLRCANVDLPGRIFQDLAVFRIHHQSKGNTNFQKQFKEDLKVAKKYTQSPLTIFLHSIFNKIIATFYTFLKH